MSQGPGHAQPCLAGCGRQCVPSRDFRMNDEFCLTCRRTLSRQEKRRIIRAFRRLLDAKA